MRISMLEIQYICRLRAKSVFKKKKKKSIYQRGKIDYLNLFADSRRKVVNDQDEVLG